jgi:very-short-patch-repair endonuclease
VTNVEQLRALASYYREILAALSHQTGKHLVDLGTALRYGLTADLGVYVNQPSIVLDEDVLSIRIERMSPDTVSGIVERATAIEEAEAAAPSSDPPESIPSEDVSERRSTAARLIAIYRKQEQDPFNRETIIGWPIVSGKHGRTHFCAPLLYFPVRVHYDPVQSLFTATLDFEAPTLNSYLLAKLATSDGDVEIVRQQLLPYLYKPDFDIQALEDIVRIAGEMVEGLRGIRLDRRQVAPLKAALENRGDPGAALYNTLVIVNAARTGAFLQDDLAALSKLEEVGGETVVETLLADIPENVPEVGDADDPQQAKPLLFPLVSNRAQRTVARKAEQARLLVVQGPPGTGKSHTIANLVCHLVAQGHSVLVTSHQNKALEVIMDDLPQIEYLAMSMLKGEKESVAQLGNQLERFTTVVEGRSLATLERSRDECLKQIREAEADIQRLQARFSELKHLERDRTAPYSRYHELREYNQIDAEDQVPAGAEARVGHALAEWWQLARSLGRNLEHVERVFGGEGTSAEVVEAIGASVADVLRLRRETLELCRDLETATLVRAVVIARTDTRALRAGAQRWRLWLEKSGPDLVSAREVLEAGGVEFPELGVATRIAAQLGPSAIDGLKERAEQLFRTCTELVTAPPPAEDLPRNPKPAVVRATETAVAVLEGCAGSRLRWLCKPEARRARQQLQPVGLGKLRRGQASSELPRLKAWVRCWSLRHRVVAGVEQLREAGVPLTSIGRDAEAQALARQVNLARMFTRAVHILAAVPRDVLPSPLLGTFEKLVDGLSTADEVEGLVARLLAIETHLGRLEALATLGEGAPGNGLGDVVATLLRFMRQLEGADEDPSWLPRVEALREEAPVYARLVRLEETELRTLPKTLRDLRQAASTGVEVSWVGRPDLAIEAHRLGGFVRQDGVENPDDIGEIARRIGEAVRARRDRIAQAVRRTRLVALKRAELDNASHQQVVLLRQLLRRRRKTPSLVQLRGRIDYRQLLRVFPCWLMSIEDVARVFPLEAGLFDYLIVDEASQCNQATALHLAYRAKRLIVVGDRQQLKNPQVRFLADDVVRFLLAKYGLDTHRRAEFLHGRESLLALAEAGANTSAFLNEHFRCEPEIITWSNRHFYDSRLRVLTPIRARRFAPVAEVHLVRGADDEPEVKRNRREAEAVVEEIRRLIRSGEADGLTIGAISPFEAQAALIHNLLHEAFSDGPEVLREHRLVAATADGFQGDERDIILYSFRFGPSTSAGTIRAIEMERERLNVAFSRAKRKIVCFASVPTEGFPSGLIRDFLAHAKEVESRASSRLEGQGPDQFDSEFERIVCEMLRTRGLQVLTQVPCGGFRIDQVVIDRDGRRIAVECDGEFHYEDDGDLRPEDYHRQDIIERAGWVVHRLAARRFFANPEAAIDQLLARLAGQAAEAQRVASEVSVAADGDHADESSSPVIAKHEEGAERSVPTFVVAETRLERPRPVGGVVDRESGPLGAMPQELADPQLWFRLSHWGKMTGRSTPYVNRFCYDIGRRLSRSAELTARQIRFAREVWASAVAQGFDPAAEVNGT